MPVYKDESKKKNKYWYEFEAGKDPLSGKRRKIRKKGFATEKEAKAAMVKAENEFNEGAYIEPSKQQLSEYLLRTWLPLKTLARTTRSMYEGYIRNHLSESLIGNTELAKLSMTSIQEFFQLIKDKKLKNGIEISPNTVQKIYSILNTALNDAVTMKLLKENPAKSILNKPRTQKTETIIWNEQQIRKFVNESAERSRYSLVFRFALMTGLRQGEVLGLRWEDVDLNNNLIRVTQTLEHDGKEIKKGAKSKSSIRTVRIDDKTKIELTKHFNRIQLEKKQFMQAVSQKQKLGKQHFKGKKYQDYGLVFCTALGTPCSPRNIMRAFYDLLEVIDVPKVTFHELRHTQATLLLKRNVHPKIVSERLGHSSVKITLDTYSHMLPEMQELAVNSLADVL